jgi:hypothetical protein
MDFPNLTHRGIISELNKEFRVKEINQARVDKLKNELKNRSLVKNPIMSYDEQVYWILEDFNFEKVMNVHNYLGLVSSKIMDIAELKSRAQELLSRVAAYEEIEAYQHYSTSCYGLVAEKFIFDGVGTLKLSYQIADWYMDYECVVLSDFPYSNEKFVGIVND